MNKIELSQINDYLNFDIDYFFSCASFEERCFSIALNLDVSRINNAIVCYNQDQIASFKDYEKRLINILSLSKNIKILEFNSDSPISIAEKLINLLYNIELIETKTIVVDITTFTHEALLILFRVLTSKRIPSKNITFLYNNASDYSINEEDPYDKWLTIGIKEIRSIIGYSGFISPLRKTLLIVLVGFEPHRTKKLIENYEPHSVVLGVGNDYCADNSSAIEINRLKHYQLMLSFPNSDVFEFSVLNPEDLKNSLEIEVNKYPDYNIVIAPMNNKISTIGAALLALENTDLQLCYVPATYYNVDGYSSPGTKCYIFQTGMN